MQKYEKRKWYSLIIIGTCLYALLRSYVFATSALAFDSSLHLLKSSLITAAKVSTICKSTLLSHNFWLRKLAHGRELYIIPTGDIAAVVFMTELLTQLRAKGIDLDKVSHSRARQDGKMLDKQHQVCCTANSGHHPQLGPNSYGRSRYPTRINATAQPIGIVASESWGRSRSWQPLTCYGSFSIQSGSNTHSTSTHEQLESAEPTSSTQIRAFQPPGLPIHGQSLAFPTYANDPGSTCFQ